LFRNIQLGIELQYLVIMTHLHTSHILTSFDEFGFEMPMSVLR
jgi:hypothetical protein